jgi:hypothetical protein
MPGVLKRTNVWMPLREAENDFYRSGWDIRLLESSSSILPELVAHPFGLVMEI